jgi:hypothetical protein
MIYVAALEGGLKIIDASDKLKPIIVGDLATSGYATCLGLIGPYAYVGCSSTSGIGHELKIVDTTNPKTPRIIHQIPQNSAPHQLVTVGDITYVGSTCVQVFDVHNPSSPVVLVEDCDWTGYPGPLLIEGTRMYSGNEENGFWIFDLSDPLNPTLLGRYLSSSYTSRVHLRDQLALVADEIAGFKTIDVSDPQHPKLLASASTGGRVVGVALEDNTAFVIDSHRISAYDITDPRNPALRSRQQIRVSPGDLLRVDSGRSYVGGIKYDNGTVVGCIEIRDIRDPIMPILGEIRLTSYPYPSVPTHPLYNMDVVSNRVFVAEGPHGLSMWAVDDPSHPTFLGRYTTRSTNFWATLAVKIIGRQALILYGDQDRQHRLQLVDVTDPSNVTMLSSVGLLGRSFPRAFPYGNIQVHAHHAYVADGDGGLAIVNIANPAAISVKAYRGTTDNTFSFTDAQVADDYIMVAAYDLGLLFFDNPAEPHPPAITVQPRLFSEPYAGRVTLACQMKGSIPLSFHWEKDGKPISENPRFLGTDTSTLSIVGIQPSDLGTYFLVSTNQYGFVTSEPVLVTTIGLGFFLATKRPAGGLSFLTDLGATYRVQRSTDLQVWTDADRVTGTGAFVEWGDNQAWTELPRFYRIASP